LLNVQIYSQRIIPNGVYSGKAHQTVSQRASLLGILSRVNGSAKLGSGKVSGAESQSSGLNI
jgi:hypothetical protein